MAKNADNWPLPAFHFSVVFGKDSDDAGFQEVSGISTRIETETLSEGGNNTVVYHLPKAAKHDNLILKRGVTTLDSTLTKWCKTFFDDGFAKKLEPKDLTVRLLDEKRTPVRIWLFRNAYPVGWKMDALNSTKNEVAIEEIELCYSEQKRVK
ncbi:phage tail protein [Oceanospirillum sediminis]|uniref:Phage tail protein n=1 Tax=Oceanospirillum sediminis TaxID=2760088 RepID=A0A839IQF5_9GAMM|nr:phage tail protein [Oceanospirillum sediminis]MBB1487161.1 phage tail protein [Oceanospirillum sediminis]